MIYILPAIDILCFVSAISVLYFGGKALNMMHSQKSTKIYGIIITAIFSVTLAYIGVEVGSKYEVNMMIMGLGLIILNLFVSYFISKEIRDYELDHIQSRVKNG